MKSKFTLVVLVLPLAVTAFAQNTPPANGKKPNIVFILADNLGYGVPSSNNGGILDTPTPRIDKLASEGLWLTSLKRRRS